MFTLRLVFLINLRISEPIFIIVYHRYRYSSPVLLILVASSSEL